MDGELSGQWSAKWLTVYGALTNDFQTLDIVYVTFFNLSQLNNIYTFYIWFSRWNDFIWSNCETRLIENLIILMFWSEVSIAAENLPLTGRGTAMVFRRMFSISWLWLLSTRTLVTNRRDLLSLRVLHLWTSLVSMNVYWTFENNVFLSNIAITQRFNRNKNHSLGFFSYTWSSSVFFFIL